MNKLSYYYSKFVKKVLLGKSIKDCFVDKTAIINNGSSLLRSTMGKYSYCGYYCEMIDTDIGAFCSIADHVFIGGAEHPLDWCSTSPVFQSVRHSGNTTRFAAFEVPAVERTIIGNDVWIGHSATIKRGVHIGDGAVIGSNAVVTKDVPPYAIVAGIPAKIIKYRFDKKICDELYTSRWWNLDDEQLKKVGRFIKDPLIFIREVNYIQSSR